jgi:hypothetical protein
MGGSPITTQDVVTAFAVGWQMAELYHAPIPTQRPPVPTTPPDHLPGLSAFHPLQVTELHLGQVTEGTKSLIATAGTDVERALSDLQAGLPAGAGKENATRLLIATLHTEVFSALTIADFRLGKAYGLGRALAETDIMPRMAQATDRVGVFKEKFDHDRLVNLYRWLADLTTTLPDHAAYAVNSSLLEWEVWVTRASFDAFDSNVDIALRRQGEQWRGLLSGERSAEDFLTATAYVNAAEGLSNQLARTIGKFASRYKGTLALALLLVVVVVGGFVAGTAVTGNSKYLFGMLTVFLGVVGGWKGISGTLGKGLKVVEPKLWQSELDGAIATQTLILPSGASTQRQIPELLGRFAADDPLGNRVAS